MRKAIVVLSILVLGVFFFGVGCGQADSDKGQGAENTPKDEQPLNLDLATFNMGSSWYVYGTTISELARDVLPKGSKVNVLAHAGGVGNLKLVGDGKAQLGLGFNVTDKWAYEGKHVYDKAYPNLRGLAGYMDEYYFGMVTRKGLEITELAQLKEKKPAIDLMTVPVGGLGEAITKLVLEHYGITYEDIKAWGGSVQHTDHKTIIESFRDGKADMYMHTISKGHPSLTELAVTTPLNFIGMQEHTIEKLCNEYGFVKAELPAGTFNGQDEAVPTIGLTTTFFTTEDLSEDIAYKITKALVENKEALEQGHKALKRFTPEDACKPEGIGIPLHPGAEKYYKEAGLLK